MIYKCTPPSKQQASGHGTRVCDPTARQLLDPATGVAAIDSKSVRIKWCVAAGVYSPPTPLHGKEDCGMTRRTLKNTTVSATGKREGIPRLRRHHHARGNASSYLTQHLKQFHNLSATVGIKTAIAGWGDCVGLRDSMRSPNLQSCSGWFAPCTGHHRAGRP